MAIIYIVIVLTTMSLICVQIPFMIIPCVLVICASISLQRYYAKKVEACRTEFQKTNDEVFIHLSDSLEGIKILRTAEQISWSFEMLTESFTKTRVSTLVNEQCVVWLMRRADALGVALSFTTCILSITLDLSSSSRGLAVSSSLSILVFYSWFMRNLASAIYCSGSVDRVYDYVRSIPREERAGKAIDKSWPKSGNVQVRMRPERSSAPLCFSHMFSSVQRRVCAIRALASSCYKRSIIQAFSRGKSRRHGTHWQRQEYAFGGAVPHHSAVEWIHSGRRARCVGI